MNELCDLTIVINNIKQHNYTIGDYKLCENEASIVLKYLEKAKKELEFDEKVNVPIA